jgi:acyl CoA:acetate/3-ketoacid CoA transferase alpha subunit/acyl CoA:acetate/3-ketoacid CoA transferase beta subunit
MSHDGGHNGAGSGKVMSLADAIKRFVKRGAAIHLAYSGGRPNAAIAEIVRQFSGKSPGFTVSAHGLVNTQHVLLGARLVDRLCVAFAGENYPTPRPNPVLQRALAEGSVTIENWSIWTLTARLIAGALGVEAFPVRSLDGSDLGTEHLGERYARSDPFGLNPHAGVVRALRPDLVLLQATAADAAGNVVLAAPYGEGLWGAMAARIGVIACVEEIVDTETVRHCNTSPVLPAHLVRAVCRVPRGSHPYALYTGGFPGVEGYSEDGAFMKEVQEASRDPEAFAAWTAHWITGVSDQESYLELLTTRPALGAAGNGGKGSSPSRLAGAEPLIHIPQASPEERMTLATARIISQKVVKAGHDSIAAGIGLAHLAAWVAAEQLRNSDVPVQLLAEVGMSDFTPLPGDPYLFASQNLPICMSLTDVTEVLGATVAGPATSCIGVLGAAQIDAEGNLNSTWSEDGRFLVGSGGANDIASAAEEVVVVVKHDPGRLVGKLPYITAPGRYVTTIVTTKGIFERTGGVFVLTGYFAEAHDDPDEIIDDILRSTGWEVVVSDLPQPVLQPSAEELALLRSFDPLSVFLKSKNPTRKARHTGQHGSIQDRAIDGR